MTFTIKIKCDNAAFDNLEGEIARLLRDTAVRVLAGGRGGGLVDENGNRVGAYALKGAR